MSFAILSTSENLKLNFCSEEFKVLENVCNSCLQKCYKSSSCVLNYGEIYNAKAYILSSIILINYSSEIF